MKTVTCDRCQQPASFTVRMTPQDVVFHNTTNTPRGFDLCPLCKMQLQNWLTTNQADSFREQIRIK